MERGAISRTVETGAKQWERSLSGAGDEPASEEKPASGDHLVKERTERAIRELQRGGDSEVSFRFIYDRYYPSVRRHFERKRVPPDCRPDLIQMTFLRIYKGVGGLQDPARFEAFLRTTAQRVFLKWLERVHGNKETIGGRTRMFPDDGESLDPLLSDEPWPLPFVARSSPEQDLRYKDLVERVTRVIEEMPTAMSRIARLRFIHGLSNKEITKVLHKKPGDVGYQLHQARKKLAKVLKEDRGSSPDIST